MFSVDFSIKSCWAFANVLNYMLIVIILSHYNTPNIAIAVSTLTIT